VYTHHLPHCSQERLAKELAPYLKEIGGYSKATDKTLDLLFDEACRESLRVHCLDRADGYTRRDQYKKVTPHPRVCAPKELMQCRGLLGLLTSRPTF
jgi:hypothetical protein